MDISDLKSLYLRQLQELCDCHSQMVPTLENMATAAGSVEVQNAIQQQAVDVVLHRQQLETILRRHGSHLKPGSDEVATAFAKRAQHVICSIPDPDLRDTALISMLRRIVQYKAAGVAAAEGYAEALYLGIDRHTLLNLTREQKFSDERLAALHDDANRLALMVSTPHY